MRAAKPPPPGSANAFLQEAIAESQAAQPAAHGGPLKYEPGRTYEHLAQVEIPWALLDPNKFQPRGWVNPVKVRDIANSIAAHGQLQAISVKQTGDRFMIIGGETRVQAIRLLHDEAEERAKTKYLTVRAEVRHGVNDGALALEALHENVMREDLNPMDVAAQLALLRGQLELTTANEVAVAVGQDARKVRTLLMLFDSCPPVIHAAVRGQDIRPFLKVEEDTSAEQQPFSIPSDAPRREERMLMREAAVEFGKLYGALRKTDPRKSTQTLARRILQALDEQWSVSRIKRFVAEQTEKEKGGSKRARPTLMRIDDASVVLNLRLLAEAPDDAIVEVRAKLDEILRDRRKFAKVSDAPEEGKASADAGDDGVEGEGA